MTTLPDRAQQIIQSHAVLIVSIVKACQDSEMLPKIEPMLKAAEEYGKKELSSALRKILDGSREPDITKGLDGDDEVIIEAILKGLQDPSSLPDPRAKADGSAAAPGLAKIIQTAARGDENARLMVTSMAEQMDKAGGSMASMGDVLSKMVQGERDPKALCENMDARGETLVLSILLELNKLKAH
jgi:hypothetical protein